MEKQTRPMNKKASHSYRKIEATAFALFKSAQALEKFRFIANIIFLATALMSLFIDGYFLYSIAIVALGSGAASFFFRLFANRRNIVGYSLHRVTMLAKAYRLNGDHFDIGYLLSKVPTRIYNNAVDAAQSDDPSGEYAAPVDDSGASRLRWMIQENAFFNAALYDACADKALRFLLGSTVVLLLCALFVIPLADGKTEYMVLRVVLILLSLAIVYDQIERCSNWRVASKVMTDLENELARFKNVPDYRVLLLFSNYHVTISGAHEILPSIYEQNRNKLNDGWRHRLATLQGEWSDVA